MQLEIRRIILFVADMRAVGAFYQTVVGLQPKGVTNDPAWQEFDAGGCTLALHKGSPPKPSRQSPKIVFGVSNVRETREELIKRGGSLGPVKEFGDLQFCDGKDPEGNVFQISNRK